MELERRFTTGLEVRRVGGTTVLEGTAVPYDVLSVDMGFREKIKRGAFSRHLRTDPDVRCLVEHDATKILGRTSAGTMTLIEDDAGVRVSINPPDTHVGRDVIASITRGDIRAMSFGFTVKDDRWDSQGGEHTRPVEAAELHEVSITASPCYEDSSVKIAMRSWDRWREEHNMKDGKVTTEEVQTDPVTKTEETTTAAEETRTTTREKPERRTTAEPIKTSGTSEPRTGQVEWRNHATGEEVRVLRPDQHFADLHRNEEPLSLGKVIRAAIVGDWRDAEREQRAMSGANNALGGFLVPDPLAANVIDLARAQSVLIRAGASTVQMDSATLALARITADPTIGYHSENETISEDEVEFDRVNLTAYTLAVIVRISRELASDAPNAVSLIESTLAKALAARIDWLGLRGTGGAGQPLGLVNFENINAVGAIGADLDWDDILEALSLCEIDNQKPNAYVFSPANWLDLRLLKSGDGTNSAKLYREAPAAIAALQGYSTTALPDSDGLIGDFGQFIVGLRQSPTIEVTTEGGDSFTKHSVLIKAVWRGDFAATHQDAFCKLPGIS